MESLPSDLKELNVLTLNCWGLLHISDLRTQRLAAIGHAIAGASPAPHIVALQECWTQEDYRSIRRATRFILPYGKFYHSGVFGGGLVILSKWPIEESSMYQYPLNGRPTAFFRGDWFVGKGVATAKVRFGRGPKDVIEVFNTHTHPNYEKGPKCSYTAHRLSQAWELAKLLRGAAARGHLVIAMGDLNDVPLSLSHRIITSHAPVRDVWRVLHPDSSLGAAEEDLERARRRPIPTAQFNIDENGATSNSVYNTWRWSKSQRRLLGPGREHQWPQIAPDTIDPRGKRLDYIFASSGHAEGENPGWAWVVHDARVGMIDRHPDLGCSLSDHFSVEATLVVHRADSVPSSSHSHSPSHTHSHSHTRNRSHGGGGGVGIMASGGGGNNGQPYHQQQQYHHSGSGNHLGVGSSTGLAVPYPTAAASIAETRGTEIQESQLEKGVYLHSPTTSETHLPAGAGASRPRDPNAPLSSSFPAQLEAAAQRVPHLPGGTYDEVLAHVDAYAAREHSQRRARAVHFATWLLVCIACYVGVWWSPPYVAFILLVLCTLGLAAGVVDGLIALLFVGSELRALREFEWEIVNAKAAAMGAVGPGYEDDDGPAGRGRGR